MRHIEQFLLSPILLEIVGSLSLFSFGQNEQSQGSVSLLWECRGETAPAQQHAPIMGQPCLRLASAASFSPHPCVECKIRTFATVRTYAFSKKRNMVYKIIEIHSYRIIIITITNPPHPCFPGMRFLVLVKGLHQTFTPFFNLIWSYHALDWALPPDCPLPISIRQYTRVCSPPPHDRLTQINSVVTLQTLVFGLVFSNLCFGNCQSNLYPKSNCCAG